MGVLQSNISPEDTFSKFQPKGVIGKFLNFPLCRILVILVFFAPIMLVNSVIVFQLIEKVTDPLATYIDMVRTLITLVLLVVSYHYYCKIFEKRDSMEISTKGALRQWTFGALVATSLVVIFIVLIIMFGEYTIVGYRPAIFLFTNFIRFTAGAFLQELVLLCIIYRLLEEMVGTWMALIGSLLLFAGVHAFNEGETIISIFMLMVSSLVLIAPFILTRQIWLSWGFHAAWNFMQAGVFGMANSGIMFEGWIIPKITGPQWVTGGTVGLEGTYLSVAIDFFIGLILLLLAVKTGKVTLPKWQRVST